MQTTIDRRWRTLRAYLPTGQLLSDERWRPRHRGIVALLWLHVVVLPLLGMWWGMSPRDMLVDVVLMVCAAALASEPRLGRRWRSAWATLGLVVASTTLVHISGGYIEAHFHFFVVIVVIALYQDWFTFLIALGYVLLHHGLIGTLDPTSVYNHPDAWAHPWKWAAIHSGFVLAIAVASLVKWRLQELQELALRASEARYRTLVEDAADGIVLTTIQGAILSANAAAAAMIGYRRDDLVGRSLGDLVPAEDLAATPFRTAELNAGRALQTRRRVRHRDGSLLQIDVSAKLVGPDLVQGIWRDVTERAHAAAALRESEARFRLLAENAQDLIFRYRILPTPGFDYVSPASTMLLGYTPEEFYADPEVMFKLVHPDDREKFLAIYTSPELTDEQLMRWVHKDGTVVWIEQLIRPVFDAGGEMIAVEGISRDATARVLAEAALRDSEALSRAIVETAVDAIVTMNEDGVVLTFNPAAERLFGYAAAEIVGGGLATLMHAADAVVHHAGMANYRATGERRVIGIARQVTGRRKDGSSVPLDLAVSEVQLSGRRIYTGIMHDLTARVRLFEQERAARAEAEAGQRRLRLLANVAQELARPDLEIAKLLHQIVRRVAEGLGDGGTIRLLSEDGTTMLATQRYHTDPETEQLLRRTVDAAPLAHTVGLTSRTFASREAILLNGEAVRRAFSGEHAAAYRPYFERYTPHSSILAPLRVGQRVLGTLALTRDRTAEPFSTEDRDLVQEVADRTALAIENIRLRQTEAALREDEERFRSLYAMDGQVTFDLDGRLLSVNRAACEMMGYDEAEAIGMRTIDLTHQDDRAVTAEMIRRLKAGEVPYYHLEKRFLRKDGSTVYCHTSVGLVRDDDGAPRYMIAMLQDIGERKRAEAALAESEERHRSVVASLEEGVVLRLADWSVTTANANAARLLGLTPAQEAGLEPYPTGWGMIREDGSPFTIEEWPVRVALDTGQPLSHVTMGVRHGDGALTWLDVNVQPLFHDGETTPYAAVTSFFDITRRRQTEAALREATAEAERANRAKSEFLSRMSHELRTPLNAILGFAQLLDLDRDLLRADHQEGIAHILKGGKHLLALINEVLDLARIESGRLSLSPEPVEVREVLAECLDLIRPLAERRAITLDNRFAAGDECYIVADRQRLKQVVLNLLSNAVKYNRHGGLVAIDRVPTAAGRLRLVVRDTGSGIPTLRLDRLFTPFERLGAEGGEIEGTGLGLAVAKQLTESMDGAIGLAGTSAAGSTFWFELPMTENPLAQAGPLQQPLARSLSARSVSHTILVVEDNPANLRLIERVLAQRPDLAVLTAIDGEMGLALARECRPDLILLDQHLPGIPGEVVLARLRADPETCTIPTIMVSADATPRQFERLLDAGASAYLTKPIDVAALLATVEQLLTKAGVP